MEKQALHRLVKKAARNAYRRNVLKNSIKVAFELSETDRNNAIFGGVLGGALGLANTALSDDPRKSYLKSILRNMVLGGLAGYAASQFGAPDMVARSKPYLNQLNKKFTGTVNGAIKGYNRA